ncbi:adenylate cyclase [Cypionkella aquatica]|uniref:Adenylate cyclase n=1 Tax=Cypionkella aquatica TaxID=1756042 RepID=A0AA37TS27_9RHOB|nr:adenylate/guanylate cyclase domain-containing protein [Cypionkella aquatica]GLS86353.1 adenylate cyclase [Cypionkella aquatica]
MQSNFSSIRDFLVYLWTGGPYGESVPARVMAEIDRRETAAEQTISWAQLGIVGFFTALYWIAPRAEGGFGENFVPMTLAAYLVFTVFRVFLSYRMVLPGWYLLLSMVVDVGLLCGMIFSFHIQYNQPPAFYLKSPTMIYLFFFIALRALRFDPRYVLMSGLIAASGWVLMVLYALTYDMGDMHITRNYVEYLTSNTILIGAEIDKVMTLLGVTLILTFALFQARSVLIDAIQSHAAADDLSQFFAPEVADLITQSAQMPASGQSEVRSAAIMFVDVRRFTTTALSLPPATVMRVLEHYQQIVLTVIEQQHGQIDKFMGDGILVTFGALQHGETYAADALQAASSLIAALDERQDEFAALGWPGRFVVGVAVASGDVTVGIVGSQGRYEFTVIGHAVNLASKLESANKAQHTRALTDAITHARAEAQGYANPAVLRRDGVVVKGLSAPVDLVVLA